MNPSRLHVLGLATVFLLSYAVAQVVRPRPIGRGPAAAPIVSDITGLAEELAARAKKSLGYLPSRAIRTDANGDLSAVIGEATDCVRVNGTSGACGTGTGGSPLSVQADGTEIDDAVATLNFAPGVGILHVIQGDAGTVSIAQTLDTAVVATLPTIQSGTPLRCASSTATDAHTCTMSPTLAGYVPGMVVEFVGSTAGVDGAATLDIDLLGAKSIKQCDGTTDPAASQISAGQQTPLRYDGTAFRLPCAATAGGLESITNPGTRYPGPATVDDNTHCAVTGLAGRAGGQAHAVRCNNNGAGWAIWTYGELPATWTGTIQVKYAHGMTDFTGTTQTAKHTIAVGCFTPGTDTIFGSTVGTYNTAASVTQSYTATQKIRGIVETNSALSLTGCASGDILSVRVDRDPSDAADTANSEELRIGVLSISAPFTM